MEKSEIADDLRIYEEYRTRRPVSHLEKHTDGQDETSLDIALRELDDMISIE